MDDVLKLTGEREKTARSVDPATPVSVIRRSLRKMYLAEMIDRRLLVLGAVAHPEWVSDASVEREVQKQLARLGPDEVERRRNLAGVSKDDFQDQFRRFVREELMKREVLRREVEQKATVTEEDIRARYDRDREKVFHRPDSWAVYHLDQYLPRDNTGELPKLREQMEALRAQASTLIGGATSPQGMADLFAPLVAQHSHAPDGKTGYAYIYDTLDLKFDPEFVKRVKEATVGELSPVFELAGDEKQSGLCFFLTFEHKKGVYTEYEQAQRLIHAALLKEKGEENKEELFRRLREEYPVTLQEDKLYQGIDPEITPGGSS